VRPSRYGQDVLGLPIHERKNRFMDIRMAGSFPCSQYNTGKTPAHRFGRTPGLIPDGRPAAAFTRSPSARDSEAIPDADLQERYFPLIRLEVNRVAASGVLREKRRMGVGVSAPGSQGSTEVSDICVASPPSNRVRENSGGGTVRKPRIRDVKVDTAGTRRLRAAMAGRGSVKITINVDADSLAKLKALSAESGVPYQRLLNSLLKERLSRAETVHARLDRIERELARVKRRLAA